MLSVESMAKIFSDSRKGDVSRHMSKVNLSNQNTERKVETNQLGIKGRCEGRLDVSSEKR